MSRSIVILKTKHYYYTNVHYHIYGVYHINMCWNNWNEVTPQFETKQLPCDHIYDMWHTHIQRERERERDEHSFTNDVCLGDCTCVFDYISKYRIKIK